MACDAVDMRMTRLASWADEVVVPCVTVTVEKVAPEPTSAMKRWVYDNGGSDVADWAVTTAVNTP